MGRHNSLPCRSFRICEGLFFGGKKNCVVLNLAIQPSLAVNGPLHWNDRMGDHGCVNNHWKAAVLDHFSHILGSNPKIVGVIAGLALNLQIVERKLQGLNPLVMELKFVAGFR